MFTALRRIAHALESMARLYEAEQRSSLEASQYAAEILAIAKRADQRSEEAVRVQNRHNAECSAWHRAIMEHIGLPAVKDESIQ